MDAGCGQVFYRPDAGPRAVRHCESVTGALVRCGGLVGADARGTVHRRHAPPGKAAGPPGRGRLPGARDGCETCETDDGMVAAACSPGCGWRRHTAAASGEEGRPGDGCVRASITLLV